MEPITINQAALAIGAKIVGTVEGIVRGICTDTRQEAQGTLFFALRGETGDGHQYVAEAMRKGAVAVVVQHPVEEAPGTQLVVTDTLRALGMLGRFYRQRFDIPVIGVTGSVGKTSTKETIAFALSAKYRAHASAKNFNNEIGVPLTLFGLEPAHQVAVIEMAMRGRGQIAELAEIALPAIGVITNIGISHIELLGSRDAIASTKAELLESLPAHGTAIIPADDDYADYLRSRCSCPTRTFGVEKSADFHVTEARFTEEGHPHFRVNGNRMAVPAPGVHHLANVAAACAVADTLGISLEAVAEKLLAFRPPTMRMETLYLPDGSLILNDAYNAAPDSMRAALMTLRLMAQRRGGRSAAVLGEMRELGEYALEAHRYVGRIAASERIDLLVTVGEMAKEIGRTAMPGEEGDRWRAFDTTEEAAARLSALLLPGDCVLVKGSRALQMEKIVAALAPV
jgi:UDP-N-acetylmuramoyl-tripeptide--D-alanyl-D-alanine ligase